MRWHENVNVSVLSRIPIARNPFRVPCVGCCVLTAGLVSSMNILLRNYVVSIPQDLDMYTFSCGSHVTYDDLFIVAWKEEQRVFHMSLEGMRDVKVQLFLSIRVLSEFLVEILAPSDQ